MWPFKKTIRKRRVEARRAAGEESWWQRFRQAGGPGSIAIAIGFYIVVVVMDVLPVDPLPYREGQFVTRNIYARAGFTVLSKTALHEALGAAKMQTPAIFTADTASVDRVLGDIAGQPERLKAVTQPADQPEDFVKHWALTPEALAVWRGYDSTDGRQRLKTQIEALRKEMLQTPLVNNEQYVKFTKDAERRVRLVFDGQQLNRGANELVDNANANAVAARVKTWVRQAGFEPAVQPSVEAYLAWVLVALPATDPGAAAHPVNAIYRYDDALTNQLIDARVAEINAYPPAETYKSYREDDKLVSGGKTLSADDVEVLRVEHQTYVAGEQKLNPLRVYARVAGRAGAELLLILLLCLHVGRYDRGIVQNHWRGLTIAGLLVLMLAANKIALFSNWSEPVAVLTVIFAAMVLTIAYNQRFALGMATMLSLLIVFQQRADLWRLIVLVAGAAGAILPLRDIRSRSRLIEVAAIAAVVVGFAVWAAGSATLVPTSSSSSAAPSPLTSALSTIIRQSLLAAGFALLTGFLVQGILPLIERFFRVATSMTLLEWCDANKPLLKRLATEAPGTFSHSLQLGAMCEAAAEAIGARGLLARVGAYYHDVGKINKPDYFVENQFGSPSRHAKLSPAMSLLIIIGHVKDGMELAREYGLPPVLREFILSHHGTTLVQYFYHAATEQRKADSERAPDEVEFRYPGPKPRSREAAILMLADAAESSCRSMPDPTAGRIENQVHAMISRRLMDGQLDDCDLTLKEVHAIEESLVKTLIGIYHSRIAYPTPQGQKPSAAESVSQRHPATGHAGR